MERRRKLGTLVAVSNTLGEVAKRSMPGVPRCQRH
ncbi:unnamed protein product [Ectocarpus sp. 12 AP-2014]